MRINKIILAVSLLISLTSCRTDYTRSGGYITTAVVEKPAPASTAATDGFFEIDDIIDDNTVIDRSGRLIRIPDGEIYTIISTSPAVTEILTGLGLGGRIIIDLYSPEYDLSDVVISAFISSRAPDAAFISDEAGGIELCDSLLSEGVNAVYMPDSASLEDIRLDIAFLAEYTRRTAEGERLIEDLNYAVDDVFDRVSAVAAKKTVYIESGDYPELYTFGAGTLLHELVSLSGGVNIFANEAGVAAVTEEAVIEANPDVIIVISARNIGYYVEITSRPGWGEITAVRNGRVHPVGPEAGTASHNAAESIYLIAEAVYPELFGDFDSVWD